MAKRILLSSNYNPLYVQFIPTVASIWKKWGYEVDLALVTDKSKSEWQWMEEYANVHPFALRSDINEGIWSKISRHFLSYLNPNDISMTGDIDMIPLRKSYFDNLFELSKQNKNKIVLATGDYNPNAHLPGIKEKVQICYMLAHGNVWGDIINPNDLKMDQLLNNWKGVNEYDQMEDIAHTNFSKFSDESLYRRLLHTWNPQKDNMIFLKRGFNGNLAKNRIDRARWNIDMKKLHNDEYIDSHSLRPIGIHKEFIAPLLEYVGVNTNLIDIGVKNTK